MGDIVQIYISKMNKFIEVSCRKKYRIADISKVMSDNIPDIKNPANNRFDPHPDSRWQAYIVIPKNHAFQKNYLLLPSIPFSLPRW